METISASVWWPGLDSDVLHLFAEPRARLWMAEPVDDAGEIAVYRELDEQEHETGRVAGIEIVGFLEFDRWEQLPSLPVRWQLPGEPATRLDTLLRSIQARLRKQVAAATH